MTTISPETKRSIDLLNDEILAYTSYIQSYGWDGEVPSPVYLLGNIRVSTVRTTVESSKDVCERIQDEFKAKYLKESAVETFEEICSTIKKSYESVLQLL